VPAGVHGAHRAARVRARIASGGSLSATVTRLPRGFAGQVTVLEISAGEGQIVAARALARGATRIILSLPSDRYAILADAASPADRPHNHDGIGALVAVHGGRRATVRVALDGAAADADVQRSRAAPGRQESGHRGTGEPVTLAAAASGAVVTVNGIDLTFPDGSQVSLDDPVVTDLFPMWHDQDGITFVETGKQFTDFAQREQDLSDSGRLDPPYHFDPITPEFTISGDARIDRKRRMSITIEVRARCTDRSSPGSRSLDGWLVVWEASATTPGSPWHCATPSAAFGHQRRSAAVAAHDPAGLTLPPAASLSHGRVGILLTDSIAGSDKSRRCSRRPGI